MTTEKKKFDKNAAYNTEWRKRELEAYFEKIRKVMSGETTDLYRLIEDEEGHTDPVLLDRLVGELLESLEHYKTNFGEDPLREDIKEFYRAYLYCAILCPEYIYAHCIYWEYYTGKNFADLILYAEQVQTYKTLHDLVWEENHRWSSETDVGEDFLFFIADCLEVLTGKKETDFYTEEEQKALKEVEFALEWSKEDRVDGLTILEEIAYEKEQAEIRKAEEEKKTAEEKDKVHLTGNEEPVKEEPEKEEQRPKIYYDPVESFLSDDEDYFKDEIDTDDIPFHDFYDDEEERMKAAQYTVDKWKETVPDPERLLKEYIKFRELLFKVDRRNFTDDIKHMAETYLYENGFSAYALDDTYGLVDKMLEGTAERLRREIRRAGFLNGQSRKSD